MSMTLLADQIKVAVDILRRGGLVAYPTDTVYGLAAIPTDDAAGEKLRRPGQSMPLLIASPRDLALVAADVPEVAQNLIRDFWPGGLTIVLRRAPDYRSKAISGDTVGV